MVGEGPHRQAIKKMKLISYAELIGKYSSAYAFLNANHLYNIRDSLVCSTSVEHSQRTPEREVSFYVFASDGYLYSLNGVDNAFSLQRISDIREFEIVCSQAHRLGDEYPIINFALFNFERKAAQCINP